MAALTWKKRPAQQIGGSTYLDETSCTADILEKSDFLSLTVNISSLQNSDDWTNTLISMLILLRYEASDVITCKSMQWIIIENLGLHSRHFWTR